MAKIYSPNKQYTGISAGVNFSQGVGEATDEYLIDWFKKHGYEVEEDLKVPGPDDGDPGPIDPVDPDDPVDPVDPDNSDIDDLNPEVNPDVTGLVELDTFTVEELIKFAEVNAIDIGKATSKEGILKKIADAAKKTE